MKSEPQGRAPGRSPRKAYRKELPDGVDNKNSERKEVD